jgi:glutamate-1-semialdehyde 2,1-aminomutase
LGTLTEAKNSIYPKIARTCDSIVNGIKDVLASVQLSCTLNSIGSMFQLFFTSEKIRDQAGVKSANTIMFRRLFDELLKQDIFIPPSQFETCFVSYAHNEDEVDKTIEAYYRAFQRISK